MADLVEVILALRNVRQFVSGADQASKAVKGVGDESEKTAAKGKRSWKGLAVGWAAGTTALVATTKFMHTAIDGASDLNEEVSKTQVVFRNAGASVVKWSQDSAEALGVSQQEALAAAGTFGNMLVPMGFARQRSAQMSKALVQLAGDMASFNNASPEDTLLALRSGLAGETEPLRKFGVFLNEARVQAQAVSMGLVKNVKDVGKIKLAQLGYASAMRGARKELREHGRASEAYREAMMKVDIAQSRLTKATTGSVPKLTAAQKAQATYAVIMRDTADAQHDLERTHNSFANVQRRLRAQYANMSATVGTQLLPVVVAVAGAFSNFLKLITPLTKNTTLLKGAIIALTVAFVAYKVAMIAATIATTVFEAAAMPVALIAAGIVLAIAAIGIGVYMLYKHVGWFRNAVNATWAAVKVAFRAIVDAFKSVVGWVKANWPLLLGILVGPFGLAVVLIVKHFDKIKRVALEVVAAIKRAFTGLIDFVKSIPDKIGGGALKGAGAIGGLFHGAVKKLPGAQHGGVVPWASPVLVGERGPEIVHLPRGAAVQPITASALEAATSMRSPIEIVVPVLLDGREIARSTARVTADKLARR